nr:uncharacterized protein LOC113699597 [Coffea arabica]
MANARTLRELAAPNFNQQSLCITFPNLDEETPFELKFGLIQLLPFFHDFSGEEPYRDLHEFDVSMKPPGITEEQIKMRAFPFSLKDAAKDWFYYLPPGSITTWEQLKKKFLKKYFPTSRAASLRKEIYGITQHLGESLYDYWERFKKLCTRCHQHQISEQFLIQYFYEGLLYTDRSLINAASGAIRQLAVGNLQQAKTCGICKGTSHLTDWCPVLQDEGVEQVTMASNKQQQDFQPQYLTKSQSYSSNAHMSLEDTVKTLVANTMQLQQNAIQYQQRTDTSIRNVENQLSQMVSTLHRLESQEKGRLPSQPEINPKNVSAITLRSEKEIKGPTILKDKSQDQI